MFSAPFGRRTLLRNALDAAAVVLAGGAVAPLVRPGFERVESVASRAGTPRRRLAAGRTEPGGGPRSRVPADRPPGGVVAPPVAPGGPTVPTRRRTGATVTDRARFRAIVRCPGRVWHVAGTGDDHNRGTATAPLRQISAAIGRAAPGDTVLVGPGTYGYTEIRDFTGTPDRWLAVMSTSDDVHPQIHVPSPTDNFVNVIGSSYVGIYGFEVFGDQHDPNTNGSGISVYGDSHHVLIWKNHIHDFPGGGVNCFDVGGSHDLVDISYNVVHGCSRYSPQNTSGISIYGARDLTDGATWPSGHGYRIVGNYVYDVQCLVPYTIGGFDFVTDGNGVSLDCLQTTHGYVKPVLVAGNVITSCGGRAVHAYNTVNVEATGNTAVGNLRTNSPAITGGVELDGTTNSSVRFIGNVICPLHTPNTTDSTSTYEANVILGGTQPVPAGNTDRRRLGLAYFVGPLSAATLSAGPPASAFAAK